MGLNKMTVFLLAFCWTVVVATQSNSRDNPFGAIISNGGANTWKENQKQNYYSVSLKNLFQLRALLRDNTFIDPMRLNGYGNYCGYGGGPCPPIDDVDRCCQLHDECFGACKDKAFICMPHLVTYSYQGLTCDPNQGSCSLATCKCDVEFIKCLQNEVRSIHPSLYRNNVC